MDNKHKLIVDFGTMYAKGTLPQQFQEKEITPNEALRAQFNEIVGLDADSKQFNNKAFRKHKTAIFEILEEIVENTIQEGMDLGALENIVEYRNLALGDSNLFVVPSSKFFRVATISDGNGNIRRQRLTEGSEFTVDTQHKAVKIYEEFSRFMSGRIDFLDMINKVSESMLREIGTEIQQAILTTFRVTGADNKFTQTISGKAPTHDDILHMAKSIEAKTGKKAVIFGSALALSKLDVAQPTEELKAQYNNTGYFGRIATVDCIEIAPMFKEGEDEFILGEDELFIVPQDDQKMIKVVNEGEATIIDNTTTSRADLQSEFLLTQKMGVSVVPSSVFGYIKFNA